MACGVQGRTNLQALACLFPIRRVHAYDIVPDVARRYAEEMGEMLDLEIVPVETAREAVEGMELVVTSGPILKEPSPAISRGWLAPGSFTCPLDFDSYLKGEAFRDMDKMATDDLAQLAYYRTVGYFRDTPDPYADLGEIVTGRKPGRESGGERTLSLNLGLAIEDVATARILYRVAREKEIGTVLPL